MRNEPLAPFTWLRVGGPADVLFLPEDEADLAGFLGRPRSRCAGHAGRRRLEPDRPRRRRRGRGDPAGSGLLQGRGAGRRPHLRRRRRARRGAGARGGQGGDHGAGILSRRAGRDRRRLRDERRLLRRRDQGRVGRSLRPDPPRPAGDPVQRRDGFRLSQVPRRRRRRADLHRRPLPGPAGRACGDRGAHGRDHHAPRGQPADPRKDRRLHLQEPAWRQRLAPGRRRRLARKALWRSGVFPSARQLPDQHEQRHRRRSRGPG